MFSLCTVAVSLLSLSSVAFVSADIPAHQLLTVPGYSGPPPTKQYSGYLPADSVNGKFLHYWFVESASPTAATDPVVLWMNGGPGCSSLDGFFYEQGPFRFQHNDISYDSTGAPIPTLVDNPSAWNTIANMIFLEAPAGVGFSYSTNTNDYNTNDTQQAIDNFRFLQNWFVSYPEYTKNEFYITGESYAGIYVPTLAHQVFLNNNNGTSNINLKGFMVGNGCTGSATGSCSPLGNAISVEYLHGHALYSDITYQNIKDTCSDLANPSADCYKQLTEMSNEIGHVNIYDIYDVCISGDYYQTDKVKQLWGTLAGSKELGGSFKRGGRVGGNHILEKLNVGGPDECIDGITAGAYLNNDVVRAALNVKNISTIGRWFICTQQISYTSNILSLLPIYPTLIANYRVLIFNGDADACVPYNGNEEWTSSLGYGVKESWRPWSVNNQVAGYVTSYDTQSLSSFQFLTVKGAGHMVPEYKPVQGLEMFRRYLNQLPF